MKVTRCESNPIIRIGDVKPSSPEMQVLGVFNCGVTEFAGKTLLLLRVAEKAVDDERYARVPVFDTLCGRQRILNFDKSDKTIDFSDVRFVRTPNQLYLTSISHLRLAVSDDGVHFRIDDKPFLSGDCYYEEFGVEDPRITHMDGWYYINYSAISRHGVHTVLARTRDFLAVEKLGIIFLSDNKDVTLFPRKIGGKYYALHRPVSAYFQRPEIWISASDDLLAYKDHRLLCDLRPGHFDDTRIGASCVPFLTPQGWLEIYHGCDASNRYCLGALLLDEHDPTRLLARSQKPILQAEMPYEVQGFMPGVVFSCGCLVHGDAVRVYYGNCDESVCLATLSVREILQELTNDACKAIA